MTGFSGEPNCIASDAVPLWECPCRGCTKIEHGAQVELGDTRTLGQYRRDEWPETYPSSNVRTL